MKSITVKSKEIGYQEKILVYEVGNSGTGLWVNGRQIEGHCQFSANSPQELMRKLKPTSEEMEYQYESFKMVRGSAQGWD